MILVRMSSGFCALSLFSLYVLLSHFRPRDVTLGKSFFQMSSYARAYVCINNKKNKRKIPLRTSRGRKWENKTYKLKRSFVNFTVRLITFFTRSCHENSARCSD